MAAKATNLLTPPPFNMMKVAVTGGTGFIGRYLVRELLDNGYEVRVIGRREINFEGAEMIKADITEMKGIFNALKGVDAVFHNAALASDFGRKEDFERVNVEGTKNVAEACIENGISRVIYTGTAGVYGFPNKNEWIDESHETNPLNDYHRSKLEGERVLLSYKNIKSSIIRPPLVLGAGGSATEILLAGIENGSMIYVGRGDNYISIVHPSDVAQCLRLALEKDKEGSIFNAVSFVCTIREMFEEIARQMDVEAPRKHIPYPLAYLIASLSEKFSRNPSITRFRVKSLGTTRRISWRRAEKMLGYRPRYDLKKTVEDMVSWYMEERKLSTSSS